MESSKRCFHNDLPDGEGRASPGQAEQRAAREQLRATLQHIERSKDKWRPDETLYTGGPGVAYMYVRVARLTGSAVLPAKDLLQLADTYRNGALQKAQKLAARDPELGGSLLCGPGGALLVTALIEAERARLHAHTDPAEKGRGASGFLRAFASYLELATAAADPRQCGSDEWLYGRAGCLTGCLVLVHNLRCKAEGGASIFAGGDVQEAHRLETRAFECAGKLCVAMLQSGQRYSAARGFGASLPLMYAWAGEEYLGAAHGLMSVLQALILAKQAGVPLPQPWHWQQVDSLVMQCLLGLLALRDANGNWPAVLGEGPGSADKVHFCHGAGGAAILYSAAAAAFKTDPQSAVLRDAALSCGELVWRYGLLKKGPGICHGVAAGDAKWLRRAHEFGRFMSTSAFQQGAKTPDHPFSLYEGLAGTACFLCDLAESPEGAAFPLFESSAARGI